MPRTSFAPPPWLCMGISPATLYDKSGKVAAHLGHNTKPGETATNRLPPAKWRPGYFSAPHGVAFNAAGDLFVAEYTVFGRIHRFNLKK